MNQALLLGLGFTVHSWLEGACAGWRLGFPLHAAWHFFSAISAWLQHTHTPASATTSASAANAALILELLAVSIFWHRTRSQELLVPLLLPPTAACRRGRRCPTAAAAAAAAATDSLRLESAAAACGAPLPLLLPLAPTAAAATETVFTCCCCCFRRCRRTPAAMNRAGHILEALVRYAEVKELAIETNDGDRASAARSKLT